VFARDPIDAGSRPLRDAGRGRRLPRRPLLSDRPWAVSSYRPDVDALAAGSTRIVIAVGEESLSTFTGRTARHHGGFLGGEFGYAGQPEALARKLRDVLADDN
jgi:hypothetical protein